MIKALELCKIFMSDKDENRNRYSPVPFYLLEQILIALEEQDNRRENGNDKRKEHSSMKSNNRLHIINFSPKCKLDLKIRAAKEGISLGRLVERTVRAGMNIEDMAKRRGITPEEMSSLIKDAFNPKKEEPKIIENNT